MSFFLILDAKKTETSHYNEEANLSEQIDVTTTTEKISTTTTTEPTTTTKGKYYIDYNSYYDYDDEYSQIYDETMISLEDINQPDFLAGNDKPVRDSAFLYILLENFLFTSVDIFKL